MRFFGLFLAIALLAASGCVTPEPVGASRGALAAGQTAGSGSTAQAPGAASPVHPSTGAAANAGGGTGGVPAGQTSEERRAAIEERLEQSLGSFDAQLKQEQERIAKEREARVAADAGTASPEGPSTDGPRGRRAAAEGGQRSGDLHSIKQEGANAGGGSGNGRSAREIPDGSDDDIIARRLRKAAEQETDPELRDKLWHEYLEYKKNGQTK